MTILFELLFIERDVNRSLYFGSPRQMEAPGVFNCFLSM